VFPALNGEPVLQLSENEVEPLVQYLKESVYRPSRLNTEAGQVDGGKGEIAPSFCHFTRRIINITYDAGSAAHVRDFRIRIIFAVIREIERRVKKAEIGKQTLR